MRKNYVSYLGWGLLVVAFIVLCIFISFHMEYLINADDSSELILSKLISDEGGILSRNWYYTTELRVLNTQLVWSFLFNFIDDWHTVRIIGNVIWYLILLISLKLFCNELNLKKYYPFIAVLFILPKSFQSEYFDIVLKGIYYIPHITITLLLFSMLFMFGRILDNKKSGIILVMCFVLSVLAGLNGLRYFLTFFIPLFLAIIFICFIEKKVKGNNEKNKRFLIYTSIILIGAIIGYLVNAKILSNYFSFDTFLGVEYSQISIDSLMLIINGWLNTLGYSVGGVLFSKDTIFNITCGVVVLTTIYSIFSIIKNKKLYNENERIVVLVYVIAFFLFILLHLFTDMPYYNRHNIMIVILGYPILFIGCQKKNIAKNVIIPFIVLLSLTSASFAYKQFSEVNINEEKRLIAEILIERGYFQGYSSYWNGNILTEVSNGEIEVWTLNSYITDIDDFNNVYDWGQLVKHSTEKPMGKVFVLLTTEENTNSILNSNSINEIIYSSEDYVLYGYKSYDELIDRFDSVYTKNFE